MLGLVFVLLATAVNAELLFSFSGQDGSMPVGDSLSVYTTSGYNFTNAKVQMISMLCKNQGTPTGSLYLTLHESDGTTPSLAGTIVQQSPTTYTAGDLTTSYVWYNFSFNYLPPLTNPDERKYTLMAWTDATDAGNYYLCQTTSRGAGLGTNYSNNNVTYKPYYETNSLSMKVYGSQSINFTITASDIYNSTEITDFAVNIEDYGNFSTTTGSVDTGINSSLNLTLNFTVWNMTNYFNRSFTNNSNTIDFNAEIYPHTLIFANDINTDNLVYNFTINFTSVNNSLDTGEVNTTSSYLYLPLYNDSYNVTISNAHNGSVTYSDISSIINASPYLQNYTFSLYSDPSSISITLYDADSNQLVTGNITTIVSSASFQKTYTHENSSLFIGNLTADVYNIRFSSDNYTAVNYVVTVGSSTHQFLNAYLSLSTSTLTLNILNKETNEAIENALIIMSRFVNDSNVNVESEYSDISGIVQLNYLLNLNYCFSITHSDYTTREFCLNPIKVSEYDVLMEKVESVIDQSDYSKVNIRYTPDSYYENQLNNFTIVFISPSGSFLTYSVNITYPGGFESHSGSNSNGETINLPFTIGDTDFGDLVVIHYNYETTVSDEKFFTATYRIVQNVTTGTFLGMRNQTFGMGVFERAVIGTGGIILFGGAGIFFGGAMFGGALALILMAFYTYTGFWTVWAVVLSMISGFIFILWGLK